MQVTRSSLNDAGFSANSAISKENLGSIFRNVEFFWGENSGTQE